MTRDICIDPRNYYLNEALVCRAPESDLPAPVPADAPALAAAPLPAPDGGSAPSLLLRDSEEFRAALLRDAFPGNRRPRRAAEDSPLAYSLFALFPAACSSHPPLEDDGAGSADSGSGGSDAGSHPLRLTGFETHDTAPCGTQGLVTDLDEGLGVCANYATNNHHLFSWDPAHPGAAASIVPLTYAPDQVLQGAGGEIYITTHQNPGLAVVNPIESSESHHPFPVSIPTSGLSSTGRALSAIRPAYPKGLVEVGGQVFVATSNYDEVHDDYQPGTVLAFRQATGSFGVLTTSGFNPTSVGTRNGRLVVVSSGAVDRYGHATSDGFVDVFDPLSYELLRTIPLGRHGAGVSGEITFSPDGRSILLPTADNSGRLLVVDLERDGAPRELTVPTAGDRVFFPSLQLSPDGAHAVVANFNDGRLYPLELATGISGTPLAIDTNTTDGEGLSDGLRVGADYFIGMGPRLLRVRAAH